MQWDKNCPPNWSWSSCVGGDTLLMARSPGLSPGTVTAMGPGGTDGNPPDAPLVRGARPPQPGSAAALANKGISPSP